MKALSPKQQQIYDYIISFQAAHGYPPSVREIGEHVGLKSPSTVHFHLKGLEAAGLITKAEGKTRAITVSGGPGFHPVAEELDGAENRVPVVGNVAAGSPILAEENITDTLSLPTEIVGDAPSFLLSVRGESMIEAGINDGDYVVVKEQPVANNGDIVVAIIDDGATVKRFFKESDHIRLQPENSTMDPIITTDCAIAGKVVAVFRRL